MKAYTDIIQSKKLAEILPSESADMCWCNNFVRGINYTDEFEIHTHTLQELKEVFNSALIGWDKYWELIPAWSLAALLDIYPMLVGRDMGTYCCWQNSKHLLYTKHYDNPVDACYEMIIKLHEQKVL